MDRSRSGSLRWVVLTRVAWLPALFILALIGTAQADDSYLPGHNVLFVDAVDASNTIFSGEILSIDDEGADNAGNDVYHAKVRVPYGPRAVNSVSMTRMGLITGVLTIPKSGVPVKMLVTSEESPPVVGRYYIFFTVGDGKHGNTEGNALKISIASQDDIADIRRLVAKLKHKR